MELEYLAKEEVLKIHEKIIERTGGTAGVLNEGLLDIVLEQTKVPEDLVQKGIVFLFGVIQNHPFVDGNKRTGFASLDIFFRCNGKKLSIADIDETENLILRIAKGEASRNQARTWLGSLGGSQNAKNIVELADESIEENKELLLRLAKK